MTQPDRPDPRPGQVWWNWRTETHVVVCGRVLRGRWRVLFIPLGSPSAMRYGKWKRAPEDYRMVKEPKR